MAGNYGYGQVYAKCPFYISDSSKNKRIVCEGITDGCRIILAYRNSRKKEQQKRVFCDEAYQNCEIYRMLMEKYSDD